MAFDMLVSRLARSGRMYSSHMVAGRVVVENVFESTCRVAGCVVKEGRRHSIRTVEGSDGEEAVECIRGAAFHPVFYSVGIGGRYGCPEVRALR